MYQFLQKITAHNRAVKIEIIKFFRSSLYCFSIFMIGMSIPFFIDLLGDICGYHHHSPLHFFKTFLK